ncbi:substrate-binding domain-containing protein [Dawidia soli]|uniref:Substrate-binding domain-containing protein n=1 Tax=Dawidia soli TaxID=2782352 RepID=A0AAP2DAY4_9BACT|nr:substrate-binding domain-containing protein [Dawidia soli]MBT1688389.1 substrate-binding domain-containing protein [Dawidia soli]
MSKKIRIKDIAEMAQVSVGTVDRVIHNRGEVAEDSYKKIMAILEKTGYKPNLLARTLGSNKTFRIAALMPNPAQDEYWEQSAEGVKQAQDEWTQYGIEIHPYPFDLYNKESFASQAQNLLQTPPDAVLTAPIFHQEALNFFRACQDQNIPFVVVNNTIEEGGSLSFIGHDLNQSGRLGAELLHLSNPQPGTYAILHVYDDVHNSLHLNEKEKGFKEYFAEQNGGGFKVVSRDLNHTHEPTLEKDLNDLLSDASLRGILVTTSKGAFIVSRLIEKKGKNGVRFVAYDLLKENLHYLQNGIIDFLINQNSKRQAFIAISQLANHLLFKKDALPTYLFPLEIISRQNLKSYLNPGH